MTNPGPTPPPTPRPSPTPAFKPGIPIGSLLLFLLGFVVISVIVMEKPSAEGCQPMLSRGYVNEFCQQSYDTRTTWVQYLSIPTIVAGAAVASRWRRRINHPGCTESWM